MTKLYDVAIIGAGPAGSFAAYKLAKAGHKVIVIERSAGKSRKVCGEYLCPKGVELLAEEGLLSEIKKEFLPLYGMELYTPEGQHVSAKFPHLNGEQAGLALKRDQFDAAIVQLALDAGAEFRFNESLENFIQETSDVVVRTDKNQYRAHALIGADGRKSKVASLLKVSETLPEKRVAIHCYLHTSTKAERMGEMHIFSDGSYAGIDPTGSNEYNLSVVCDGQIVRKLGGLNATLNHYVSQSKNLFERFGHIGHEIQISAASPLQHRVKQIVNKNVALIGDASGFIDPLTGEGIYNAMRSAQLISRVLVTAFQEQTPISTALEEYAHEHKKWLSAKSRLNRVFQFIIRQNWLVEAIGRYLRVSASRADTFIGIIGNIYTPGEGLKKLVA